jgi:hypothetical protein
MATKTLNVAELTRDEIGGIYFQSLANVATRNKNHLTLHGVAPQLVTRAIETDFCTWYGGFVSLATRLDPDAPLPPTLEMMGYISQNIGKAQAAIAA